MDEAIALLKAHLVSQGRVERAIREYGVQRDAEWNGTFVADGEAATLDKPRYIESQGIRMLDRMTDPREELKPKRFLPPEEGGGKGDTGEHGAERWRVISRGELMERFCLRVGDAVAEATWTAGAAPESIRLLCVTHDAGQGKSEFLRWLERTLRQRALAGQWVVLGRVSDFCVERSTLVKLLADQLGLEAVAEVTDELNRRLNEGRMVFLLDGLDETSMEVLTNLLADLIKAAGSRCRFVVAGRPHSLQVHWERLFRNQEWRFLLLDYFGEGEQRQYLGAELYEHITRTVETPKELLAVPRALYYVRKLGGQSVADLSKIRSPSGVYLHAVKHMVNEGLKAAKVGDLEDERAMELLAAMAFEMVLGNEFEQVGPGEMAGFLGRVARRLGKYYASLDPGGGLAIGGRYDLSWCRGELKKLASMNEVLNSGLLERGCPEQIQWRNRQLQEFFAGYWLARCCLLEDQSGLRQMLYVEGDERTHDFRWVWRFLAQMPDAECDMARWARALEPLYLPDEFTSSEETSPWKRSTEVIWRTWSRMENGRHGREVLVRFQAEFQGILNDKNNPGHTTAKRMMENFVRCPKEPADDNNPFLMGSAESEGNRYAGEQLHEVRVDPFWMGKYVAREEEYELFEPEHRQEHGTGDGYPVMKVNWYDSWVYARWVGCRLATEAEWEYACRAGTTTAYSFGNDQRELGEYAWYGENSGDKLHSVGEKRSNGWGLHDVHGLVWEWCEDWEVLYENDRNGMVANPTGPKSGAYRVNRGGGWRNAAQGCRSAFRYTNLPDYRNSNLGCRLILSSVLFALDRAKGEWRR